MIHRYKRNWTLLWLALFQQHCGMAFLFPTCLLSDTRSSLFRHGTSRNSNGDMNAAEHRNLVQQILDQDDEKYIQEIAEQKKNEELQRIHNQKVISQLAQTVGVTVTALERFDSNQDERQENKDEESSNNIINNLLSSKRRTTDQQKMWDSEEQSVTTTKKGTTEELPSSTSNSSSTTNLGTFKSKVKQDGTLVGSVGGWSLEIFPGDFVVHRKYGIGKFVKTLVVDIPVEEGSPAYAAQQERRRKLVRAAKKAGWQLPKVKKLIATFGTSADNDLISRPRATMLEISYQDGLVHVPVEKAYRLSRYKSSDAAGVKPKLSRIRGDNTWLKAREKVAQATLELAQDVLALYATRETLMRPPFDPRKEEDVKRFESTFPYEPTTDQKACFETIENDMIWRRRPMDRLICGDVGFGKTEVAMRALFRSVANGRQAVLLAPTGVLAAQHYKTIMSRMGPDTPFKVNVGFLRGGMSTNTKAGKDIRAKIGSGEIQLVVGTHALLSKSVPYNNLGLLVIDEEQRFGVKQKERLKLISSGVDVLTLSATPIPRTLQMSLSGIRDTSAIRSPPPLRMSIISTVERFSESLVAEAISRELNRGGQCFYVVPRISMIKDATKMIQNLFPGIRIAVAHGRMGAGAAEASVEEFAEGNFDLLLATTVIENGVDIPSVNTIIIQDAQNYGMSTLYQLRGRVGRSNLQGYAYFLHDEVNLTEQAVARLQAMAELHQLGSGFDVAARDLEIRGAGSLLGTEQSGMAERVGFDLYMRMLKKSIRQLKALDLPNVPRTNIMLSPHGEGGMDSSSSFFTIPATYIPDKTEREKQEGIARITESSAKLVDLTNEWKSRFGPLPSSLKDQIKTLHLHACTRALGIDAIGLLDSCDNDNSQNLVLRSPGLRPRHWVTICDSLPNRMAPAGLDAVFPGRFSPTGDEYVIVGGLELENTREIMNLRRRSRDEQSTKAAALALLTTSSSDDEDDWDGFEEEEEESMKDISSAVNIKSLADIDIEQYPRLVIDSFSRSVPEGKRVDALLKILLPVVNIVNSKHEEDKEKATAAVQLRERREEIKKAQVQAKKNARYRNDFV